MPAYYIAIANFFGTWNIFKYMYVHLYFVPLVDIDVDQIVDS